MHAGSRAPFDRKSRGAVLEWAASPVWLCQLGDQPAVQARQPYQPHRTELGQIAC